MIHKYNIHFKKLIKLFIMLLITYLSLTNIPIVQLSNSDILKIVLIVGIFFLILENYYPTITL